MDSIKLAHRLYELGKIDKETYQRVLNNQELLEKESYILPPVNPGALRTLANLSRKATAGGPQYVKTRAAGIAHKLETEVKRTQIGKNIAERARAQIQTEEIKRRMAEPELAKVLKKGLQWALGIGGVGAATVGVQKIWQHVGIKRSYQGMFDNYPELRQYDEPEVKKRFISLARYAPDVMSDPMVAGGYMSHAMRYEKFDPTLIPKIMDVQTGIDRAKLLGKVIPERAIGALATKIPFPE